MSLGLAVLCRYGCQPFARPLRGSGNAAGRKMVMTTIEFTGKIAILN